MKIDELKKSSLLKRLLSGAFWSLFGSVLSRVLFLLAGIAVAHILGKEKYGELGIIRSTTNMFILIATMGLGVTTTKYISEFRRSNPDKAGCVYFTTSMFSYALAVLISIIVFFFAPYLASESLNAPQLTNEIRCGIILLFFCTLDATQIGALTGLEEFKSLSLNTLVYGFFDFSFLIIGAYFGGVSGAIMGLGISYMVYWMLNKKLVKRKFSLIGISSQKIQRGALDLSIIWKFSFPAAMSSMLVIPVFWYVKSLLVKINGFNEMASFDVADQWRIFILFIPGALSKIVLPILSNITSEGSFLQYKRILISNIIFNIMISLSLALLVATLGKYILQFYGEDFNDTTTLILLSISAIFTSIATVVGQAIASKARMWAGFVFNIIWASLLVVLSHYFLSKDMGSVGISLSFLLSYVVHAVLQLLFLILILKREKQFFFKE